MPATLLPRGVNRLPNIRANTALRKDKLMSYVISNVNFSPASNRIINQMLQKAGYVTGRMTPLVGPLAEQSRVVLQRFMAGVLNRDDKHYPSGPIAGAKYGRP